MKLSVVIVNYNVRYFLSTCLQSVQKAMEGIDGEVFVVDNNSEDDSVQMVQSEFPEVTVIANKDNKGFSSANNQAIEQANGDYVLLLNPDTIVAEDCFQKCIQAMEEDLKIGGLGVKMIDGSGKFLPESKRGLPTPVVAFYKIFGLSRLFPKSKKFGQYHLEYLDKEETHSVEVLSGAFMFLRKSLIDEIGGLDENFFMYGEDIDLSYRITQAGYTNCYFPKTSIIHFKGESTKKSSVNYVLVFYRAMIIFARKHFSGQHARMLSILINLAIYFRALIAILRRLGQRIYVAALDAVLMFLALLGIKNWHEQNVIGIENYFNPEVEHLAFPAMISIWIISQMVFHGYKQPIGMKSVFKGLFLSALLMLIFYAMLDEEYRFSRAIVVSSVIASFFILPGLRVLLNRLGLIKLIRYSIKTIGIVGKPKSIREVEEILGNSAEKEGQVLYFDAEKRNEVIENDVKYTGSLHQLDFALTTYKMNELVFCMQDVSSKKLIETLGQIERWNKNVFLKPPNGNFLLRSSTVEHAPDYIVPIEDPQISALNRRKKEFTDRMLAIVLIIFYPVLMFMFRNPMQYFRNMFSVLQGGIWLTGIPCEELSKKAILINPVEGGTSSNSNFKTKVDYLTRYSIEKDLELLFLKLGHLDRVIRD